LIDLNHQDDNFHLDYMITSLAIILLPVQAREKFLEQVRNSIGFVNDDSQGHIKKTL